MRRDDVRKVSDFIHDAGKNNKINIPDSVNVFGAFKVVVSGSNNTINISPETRLGNGIIEIRNNNSKIDIGARCLINGQLRCRENNTNIVIGDDTTIMNAIITLHEAGCIQLGEDCMLSGDIIMDVSDMHSIIDVQSGRRINPPMDILIDRHVWIAQGAHIMKGAKIGENSIIGAKSLVNSSIPSGCVAAGVPARVIKNGVTWDRRRLPFV